MWGLWEARCKRCRESLGEELREANRERRKRAVIEGNCTRYCLFEAGEVYAGDDFVYWEFGADGLARLARLAGFRNVEIVDTPIVDGHPRILGHACA